MLDGLWYGIAAAFIFIGVVATSYFIILQVFKIGSETQSVIVIPSGVSDDDVGSLLYGVHMKLSLMGDSKNNRIIVVDNGMTQSQINLCHEIMSNFNNMEFCTPQDLWTVVIGKDE